MTHAGSVMKQAGNAHDQNAKMRFVLLVYEIKKFFFHENNFGSLIQM